MESLLDQIIWVEQIHNGDVKLNVMANSYSTNDTSRDSSYFHKDIKIYKSL